jgi:hypothetical protein
MSALLAALALATSASPATPVGLGLREYRISVYRPSVPAGRVAFTMTNFGEDAHDLQVTGPNGYRSAVSADVPALGGRLRFVLQLRRPGTYRLLCVKPGHLDKGMKATLRVRRRSS